MQANEEFVILRTFLASHSTQESSKLYLNDDKHRYVTKLDHHMGKISKYMNQILPQRRDLKSSVSQFSHSVLSEYLWPHWLQNIRLPCPSPTPGAYSNSCPSSQWGHSTSSSSVVPVSSCNLSQQGLFQWISFSHEVAKVLEFQLQHQSFQWTPRTDLLEDGLVGSPCSPRDSPESSPTPWFKSISSSVLRFLYSPTLTSIHDNWKNHSFD